MKKRNKILLIVLVVIVAVITVAGIFAYKNWNTISSMYYYATGKNEELEKKRADADKRAEEAMKDLGIENIRPLTDDESAKLNSGEISKEEALNLILGNEADGSVGEKNTQTDKLPEISGQTGTDKNSGNEQNAKDKGKTNSNSHDPNGVIDNNKESEETKAKKEKIAQLIGELYVLKAQYSNDLSAIEDWVNAKYREFCKEYDGAENIPSSVKIKVGRKAYAEALALEDSCDAKFYSILDEVNVLLKETNQSTVLIDEMKSAYDNEKIIAKSYYMSQF